MIYVLDHKWFLWHLYHCDVEVADVRHLRRRPDNSGRARLQIPKIVGLSAAMHDAARGESNSPGAGLLACSGSYWCKDPVRVVLSGSFGLPVESDGAKRESIETPRRRQARSLATLLAKARGRSSGEGPSKTVAGIPWEGETQGSRQ
jgi:hypothetical protein